MAPAGIGLFIFDIGWSELVVIGVVALIAIGPKELPTVLRTLGQYMGKIKRMSAEFQGQFQEALREAELSDLKQHAQDLQNTVADFSKFDPLENAEKDMDRAFATESTSESASSESTHSESTHEALPAPSDSDTVVTQPAPTESAAAEPSEPLPAIDVPLPEPPPLPRAEDFSEQAAEPVKKQA
jgi:sec-independent protein translocase protein TatB